MFPFPLLSGHLILPLPGLQPTQCFPSKYIALVCSVYPPNVNLTSLKEREGEPKSLRNRRHQENTKPNLYIQCQIWIRIEIMLSFMFLSLALLDTFLPFPGSPSRHPLELRPILLSSRTHTHILRVIELSSVLHLVQWQLNSPCAWIVIRHRT